MTSATHFQKAEKHTHKNTKIDKANMAMFKTVESNDSCHTLPIFWYVEHLISKKLKGGKKPRILSHIN